MDYELRPLSIDDGEDIYAMLQEIPQEENGFLNRVNGLCYSDYKLWLVRQKNISEGIGLKDWMVPSSSFWLYKDGVPVGFGKLRHRLNSELLEEGGHCGYAIRPGYRGMGSGRLLVALLVSEAKKLGIDRMLITVNNNNLPSIRAAAANGGVIEKVSAERHYIWIDTAES